MLVNKKSNCIRRFRAWLIHIKLKLKISIFNLVRSETLNPMVESNPTGGIKSSNFVGKTQGKLRDHYRIGKILGTGKQALLRIAKGQKFYTGLSSI